MTLGSCVPPGLTERSDGVLLRLLLLGFPAGHQRGDGEGVRPRGQLRFGGRRELHVGERRTESSRM